MTLRGYIVILKRDGTSGSFCDWRAEKCVFGSSVSCDVHIKLDAVSPIHCTLIAMTDGRVIAESHVKPAIRTLLNGEPVIGRTFVPHNSLLTIGDRYFKFLYPEGSGWTKVGVPVIPHLKKIETISPKTSKLVADVNAFPVVRAKSPRPSPLSFRVKRAASPSPQRRALSTEERYAPTPQRSIIPSPVVNVKRHSNVTCGKQQSKSRRSSSGSRKSVKTPGYVRKKAKVTLISETPLTKDTKHIERLLTPDSMAAESMQTNNSSAMSYYSLASSPAFSKDHTYQSELLSDSYCNTWNPSMTYISPNGSKYTVITDKRFAFTEPSKKYIRHLSDIRHQSVQSNFLVEYLDDTTPTCNNKYSRTSRSLSPRSASTSILSHIPTDSCIKKSTNPNESFRTDDKTNRVISSTPFSIPTSRISADKNIPLRSQIWEQSLRSPMTQKRGSILSNRPLIQNLKPSASKVVPEANTMHSLNEKGVKFGPDLSPEQFDYRLPPSTPLKRGAVPRFSINTRVQSSIGGVSKESTVNLSPRRSVCESVKATSALKTVSTRKCTPQPIIQETVLLSPMRSSNVTFNNNNLPSSKKVRKSMSIVSRARLSKSPSLNDIEDMMKTPASKRVSIKRKPTTSIPINSRFSRKSQSPMRPSPVKRSRNSSFQSNRPSVLTDQKSKIISAPVSPHINISSNPSVYKSISNARISINCETTIPKRLSKSPAVALQSTRRMSRTPSKLESRRLSGINNNAKSTPKRLSKSLTSSLRLSDHKSRTPSAAVSPRVSGFIHVVTSPHNVSKSSTDSRLSVGHISRTSRHSSGRKSRISSSPESHRVSDVSNFMKSPTNSSPHSSILSINHQSRTPERLSKSTKSSQPSSDHKSKSPSATVSRVSCFGDPMKTPNSKHAFGSPKRTSMSTELSHVSDMQKNALPERKMSKSKSRTTLGVYSNRTPVSMKCDVFVNRGVHSMPNQRQSIFKNPRSFMSGVGSKSLISSNSSRSTVKQIRRHKSFAVSRNETLYFSNRRSLFIPNAASDLSSMKLSTIERKQSFKKNTPNALSVKKSPIGRPSPRLIGIQQVLKKQKKHLSPVITGVQELLKTPKVNFSPKLGGIRKMLKTPKTKPSPKLAGIRKLMKTPKVEQSPNLRGVRNLMKTPKLQPSPRLDGLKHLLKTPKIQSSPRLSGVQHIFMSPISLEDVDTSLLPSQNSIDPCVVTKIIVKKKTQTRSGGRKVPATPNQLVSVTKSTPSKPSGRLRSTRVKSLVENSVNTKLIPKKTIVAKKTRQLASNTQKTESTSRAVRSKTTSTAKELSQNKEKLIEELKVATPKKSLRRIPAKKSATKKLLSSTQTNVAPRNFRKMLLDKSPKTNRTLKGTKIKNVVKLSSKPETILSFPTTDVTPSKSCTTRKKRTKSSVKNILVSSPRKSISKVIIKKTSTKSQSTKAKHIKTPIKKSLIEKITPIKSRSVRKMAQKSPSIIKDSVVINSQRVVKAPHKSSANTDVVGTRRRRVLSPEPIYVQPSKKTRTEVTAALINKESPLKSVRVAHAKELRSPKAAFTNIAVTRQLRSRK